MKTLLSMLAVGVLTTTSGPTVNMVINTTLNKQTNKPNIKATETAINLNTVLTNPDLGTIYIGQKSNINEQQIKSTIKYHNHSIDINGIAIKNITSLADNFFKASAVGDNIKYTGAVEILFGISNFDRMLEKNSGIGGGIEDLAVTKDGTIYAGNFDGLYLSNDGKNFNKINESPKYIYSLIIDKNDNLYMGTVHGIYKKNKNDNSFVKMSETDDWIYTLNTDANGNIYAGSYTNENIGKVYRCLEGQNTFTEMQGINNAVRTITVAPDGTIYAGTWFWDDQQQKDYGKVYRCLEGQNTFTEIQGINNAVDSLISDNSGNIFGAVNGNIYQLLKGEKNFEFKWSPSYFFSVNKLAISNNGDIYAISSSFSGDTVIYKFNNGNFSNFSEFKGLFNYGSSSEYCSLVIDNKDTIYTGGWTFSGLAFVYKSEKI